MEQAQKIWDVALWRLASSPWPDIVVCVAVDEDALPFEVVQALMQEHKETYVYKAAVGMASRIERYWQVKLPCQTEPQGERVSVNEVVKALWSVVEAERIDPVEVDAQAALEWMRLEASDDPAGRFALWCQAAMASDERAFTDRWNDCQSAVVRSRLQLEANAEKCSSVCRSLEIVDCRQ